MAHQKKRLSKRPVFGIIRSHGLFLSSGVFVVNISSWGEYATLNEQSAQLEERRLIVRAQRGESAAFEQLAKTYQGQLYRSLYALLGNMEDTLDVVQETFARAFQAIGRFEPGSPFFPWLYKIGKNLSLSLLRKRHRKPFTLSLQTSGIDEQPLEVASGERTPAERFAEAEMETLVSEALASLKEEDREILLLREVQGLSYQDISVLLDIPIGTVMSRLYYARDRLREKMRKVLKTE